MSITITKEPSGVYPCYNDSFVEFTSSLSGNERAEISALPSLTFPKSFRLFPDSGGKYLFNLIEIAKAILNVNGFEDSNFFTDSYFKSISGLYLLQNISIEVFSPSDSETLAKNYEFFKAVKQVGESVFDNPFQILSASKNGIDYSLTYFEGFPFHFDIQKATSGNKIKVKNLNTNIETIEMTPTEDGAYRINIDRSNGENWTQSNFLPLITGLNRLEISEDGAFKTNLNLTKRKACDGVYLKWFNADGGFSHWLFSEFTNEKIKGKDISFVGRNEFLNVGSMKSSFLSTGKTGAKGLNVKTKYKQTEADVLKSLFISPLIQMYTSKEANVEGEFIDVTVEETYSNDSKRGINEIALTIDLPELITARL